METVSVEGINIIDINELALGIAEETDAIAIVVSEETGRISIAVKGELYYNLMLDDARMMLIDELRPKVDTTLLEEEDETYE